MPRPTKASLQRSLLKGEAIRYRDASKNASIQLSSRQSRNLFQFLLTSEVREPKDLPKAFVDSLWRAYTSDDDPASDALDSLPSSGSGAAGVWRIERLTTKNFGGINIYGGEHFFWELKGESWLLDGENGSGKSSLLAAIAWAFSGLRPRDEAGPAAHLAADVFDNEDKKIASWPPLASYPADAGALAQNPEVEVTLDLISDSGQTAVVRRTLQAGKVHYNSTLIVDDVFLATGIEMPLLLPALRLKDRDNEGALARAVAQLTGLEEFAVLGELVDGLCHGAREYCSYAKKAGVQAKLSDFEARVNEARREMSQVSRTIPALSPKDAVDANGPMAALVADITRSAATLASSLAADLAPNTDTSKLETQREIIIALTNANEAVSRGLLGTAEWKALEGIAQDLDLEKMPKVLEAVAAAEQQLHDALEADAMQRSDNRYRLKALSSAWHVTHRPGPVELCPLCDLELQSRPDLAAELELLGSAGPAASQTLTQNIATIRDALIRALPPTVTAAVRSEILSPRQTLIAAVRREIGSGAKFAALLKCLSDLVNDALASAPENDCVIDPSMQQEFASEEHAALTLTLHRVRQLAKLATWFKDCHENWNSWWTEVTAEPEENHKDKPAKKETIRAHLRRLETAMDGAKPYGRAADLLHEALLLGQSICEIQAEQERRDQVVAALQPLKQLPSLSQSVARQAIEDLSDRIRTILEGMHSTERFRYRAASLQKREGLTVRGSIESELRIDATLVANTSWLRSTLWAFIFALRQEAVEQYGHDQLPVWLFDDPQATFDMAHRLNWSSYVAGLQNGPSRAQIVIATHDESFAAKLRQSELHAREAIIKAARADSGPLEVLEGSRLERRWVEANADPSSKQKAIDYLSEVRVFLEGMLKAMLAGHGADLRTKSISELRDRINDLHRQGWAPFDRKHFAELATTLGRPAMEYVHQSHHTTREQLSFPEAKKVSDLWPQVSRLLTRCFRDMRDHRLLHGMPSAFQLAPSSLDFPEDFRATVVQQSLPLLGRASAFSGRISEGVLNYEEYDQTTSSRGVRLGQHGAFRLTARTMEPVARPGDILLVHEVLDPASRSLVVAIAEDQLLARRYVVSDASSDVAVLTANALDPHEIAPPVVARRETIKARRVVGVLFDHHEPDGSLHEVQPCSSESEVQTLLSRCKGLVEVAGQSAQPLALDGQHLLVGDKVTSAEHLKRLNGTPVIARDSDNAYYFKRLRLAGDGLIILESLDGGGDFPPEVLWETTEHGRTLEEAWEVLGVLFERP